MGANTEVLRTSGKKLKDIPGAQLPPPPALRPGPLSAGLVSALDVKSGDAVAFENTVRTSLDAAGQNLIQLADGMAGVDDTIANAIARLFPDSPRTGGR
jgi:hypothetical protein